MAVSRDVGSCGGQEKRMKSDSSSNNKGGGHFP